MSGNIFYSTKRFYWEESTDFALKRFLHFFLKKERNYANKKKTAESIKVFELHLKFSWLETLLQMQIEIHIKYKNSISAPAALN